MPYLALLLAVTVPLLIRAELRGHQPGIYFFKPVSTLIVIGVALLSLADPENEKAYSLGILAGLTLCFGGDLALMFQQRRGPFLLGLVLFLLGHVVYTVTFSRFGQYSGWTLVTIAALLPPGLVCYRLFAPQLGSMRLPVVLYLLIISLMLVQAAGLLSSTAVSERQALAVVTGALLFYISDIMLAANRFWRPWKYNRTSLGFYYGGQLLIALSTRGFS